jgi:hypothetical protein
MEKLKYPNGIVLFVDVENEEVKHAWINEGNLNIDILLSLEETPKSPEDFLNYVIDNVISKDKVVCSGCGIITNKISGKHFAGVYCEKCFEEFKIENSSKCLICGKPLYKCTC